MGGFIEVGLSRGYLLLYKMTPWKTPRKSMGEWDYRTRIIPLLSSRKPGLYCADTGQSRVCSHWQGRLRPLLHPWLLTRLRSRFWPQLRPWLNSLNRTVSKKIECLHSIYCTYGSLRGPPTAYSGRISYHRPFSIKFCPLRALGRDPINEHLPDKQYTRWVQVQMRLCE
jgi:hypothetical protein